MIDTLEELMNLASASLEMERAGLIRELTESEQKTVTIQFPSAVMILGNFIILKSATVSSGTTAK